MRKNPPHEINTINAMNGLISVVLLINVPAKQIAVNDAAMSAPPRIVLFCDSLANRRCAFSSCSSSR